LFALARSGRQGGAPGGDVGGGQLGDWFGAGAVPDEAVPLVGVEVDGASPQVAFVEVASEQVVDRDRADRRCLGGTLLVGGGEPRPLQDLLANCDEVSVSIDQGVEGVWC